MMALSNTLKEPRREITETAIGVAAVAAFLTADYWFACWLFNYIPISGGIRPIMVFVGMLLGITGSFLLFLAAIATHALGEGICNMLQDNGVDPRPMRRRK